jgi:biopolymer transport protein ExbD/biopolymer transport protein TolR
VPRRRRREGAVLNAEINVVSLIDVMMLLMVIFMLTAPMMQGGVDVSLPTAQAPRPLEPKGGVTVSVAADGRVYVDDAPVDEADLGARVAALGADRTAGGVYLRADRGVPYGTVVRVLAAMRASGVGDVGLVAEPDDPAATASR